MQPLPYFRSATTVPGVAHTSVFSHAPAYDINGARYLHLHGRTAATNFLFSCHREGGLHPHGAQIQTTAPSRHTSLVTRLVAAVLYHRGSSLVYSSSKCIALVQRTQQAILSISWTRHLFIWTCPTPFPSVEKR